MSDRRSSSSGSAEDNDSFFEQWKAQRIHEEKRDSLLNKESRTFYSSNDTHQNSKQNQNPSHNDFDSNRHFSNGQNVSDKKFSNEQNGKNQNTSDDQNIPNGQNIPYGQNISNSQNDAGDRNFGRANSAPGNDRYFATENTSNDHHNKSKDDNQVINLIFRKKTLRDWLNLLKTYLISFLFHLLLIIPLLFIVVTEVLDKTVEIISQPGDEAIPLTEMETFDNDPIEVESEPNVGMDPVTVTKSFDETIERPSIMDSETTDPTLPMDQFSVEPIPSSALVGIPQGQVSSAFQGRGEGKKAMLAAGGGSEGSEKAVADALRWLAMHQLSDGSWSFDLNECPQCNGKCSKSGRMGNARFGATAMALLPFISSGITPYKGEYKNNVKKGIDFLLRNGKGDKNLLSFTDSGGTMYSHGLAAILLCETYGMLSSEERSRYPALKNAAARSVEYIVYAQDPNGGGWRYRPKEPGDTSVVGWQMMALKSMQLSKLITLDKNVYPKALYFLSNVTGYNSGSEYGYTNKGGGTSATSAVGLLCRLYLDWKPDTAPLLRGADLLLETGPKLNDPYYVYYATQLFHHIGGDRWKKWNQSVRDPLIEQQCHSGHEAGSWFPSDADTYCRTGGRLYATALNCMTLQIYYRYLPLYQGTVGESQFSID